jgi:hypothetical protein
MTRRNVLVTIVISALVAAPLPAATARASTWFEFLSFVYLDEDPTGASAPAGGR